MGSGRGCDLADNDEEYGSTPRRDICDYFGGEGRCSGEQSTSGTDADPDLRSDRGGAALVCAHLDGGVAGKGIRTNMLSPGPTETPILTGQFGENTDAMRELFKTMIPMGRMGKPEDIAAAALFLASDESRFITGIDLSVDGGLVAV